MAKCDKERNGLNGYSGLGIAVVIRAAQDWRALCKGKTETPQVNFEELESFFETDCDTYLAGTSFTADKILTQLQNERKRAII